MTPDCLNPVCPAPPQGGGGGVMEIGGTFRVHGQQNVARKRLASADLGCNLQSQLNRHGVYAVPCNPASALSPLSPTAAGSEAK